MSTETTAQPTVGERAVITEFGGRTPATYVATCGGHDTIPHWCYDEPTLIGATCSLKPNARREIIHTTPPRVFQPGDVVEHPEQGRGIVYKAASDRLVVRFFESVWPVAHVIDDLTLCTVINPENDKQVGRFVDIAEEIWAGSNVTLAEALTEAVREYARPIPPVVKPPEPQRIGSAVRDGQRLWVRVDPAHAIPWLSHTPYEWRDWADMPDTVTIERGDDE